nr:hypothetical protein CFP56_61205 [Quercus suber]
MVETKFGTKAMQLFTFLQCLRACVCLEKRREAGVSTGHGVEDDNVWLENLVEQLVGMALKGSSRMESTATDELGEDSDVILEVGFEGKGLYLLELSERIAMGLERQRRRG